MDWAGSSIRWLLGVIEGAAGAIAAAIVVGFTGIMIIDVFSRYVLSIPLPWAPELSVLLFQLASFIGASIALRRGMHFGLGLVLPFEHPIIKRVVAVIVGLIVLACSIYLIRYGWNLTIMTRASNYPTLPFSHNVIYIGLMVGAGLMAIFAVEQTVRALISPDAPPPGHGGHHPVVVPKDQ